MTGNKRSWDLIPEEEEGGYHTTPCQRLIERIEVEDRIFQRLEEIEKNQKVILEMMQVWNNTKGFVSTIRILGKLLVWVVAILAAWSVLSGDFKRWVMGQ